MGRAHFEQSEPEGNGGRRRPKTGGTPPGEDPSSLDNKTQVCFANLFFAQTPNQAKCRTVKLDCRSHEPEASSENEGHPPEAGNGKGAENDDCRVLAGVVTW